MKNGKWLKVRSIARMYFIYFFVWGQYKSFDLPTINPALYFDFAQHGAAKQPLLTAN